MRTIPQCSRHAILDRLVSGYRLTRTVFFFGGGAVVWAYPFGSIWVLVESDFSYLVTPRDARASRTRGTIEVRHFFFGIPQFGSLRHLYQKPDTEQKKTNG